MDSQPTDEQAVEAIRAELTRPSSTSKRVFEKFLLAALGSIPWVGGFLSAAASLKFEESGRRQDELQTKWLEEHQERLQLLRGTLGDIISRLESLGPAIEERIQSDEYLGLVRRAFRAWDRADTDEKRKYVANLVSNAAGSRICSDDVVRLFIDWLDAYHEAHFAVIREVYQRPRSTRYEIWTSIYGSVPREASAEADLFRLLLRDLSTGGVMRIERETTPSGEFLRKRSSSRRSTPSPTMKSSFEDKDPHVLTELGKQFVHYTMNEVVPRLEEQET